MNLTVNVTQHHIDSGKLHSPCECPVALATRDAIGHTQYVKVSHHHIIIGCWSYPLEPEISHRIRYYDLGQPLTPFTFTITDYTDQPPQSVEDLFGHKRTYVSSKHYNPPIYKFGL